MTSKQILSSYMPIILDKNFSHAEKQNMILKAMGDYSDHKLREVTNIMTKKLEDRIVFLEERRQDILKDYCESDDCSDINAVLNTSIQIDQMFLKELLRIL